MKIAILTDSFPPYLSGVTTYSVELARGLIENGHKVLIFAPDEGDKNIVPKGLEGAKIVRLPSFSPPSRIANIRISIPNIPKVLSELKRFKPDLIETEGPTFLGIDGVLASKILKIPCVSTFHTLTTSKEYLQIVFNFKSNNLEKLSWIYHRWFYNSSDVVTVSTKKMLDLLIKNGIKRDKLREIPVLFDFYKVSILSENERRVLRKHYRLNNNVAVYLGRLAKEKNLGNLMRIWREVVRENKDVTLLIIGGGPLEKQLGRQITKLQLTENVRMLGPIDHEQLLSSGILSICDIFVSTSVSETFGLTGLEAMASKLPVVLYKSQGLAEIVDGGGILCKKGGIAEYKAAILNLFRDKDTRLTKGEIARKIAAKYNTKTTIFKLIAIYIEAIANYTPSSEMFSILGKNPMGSFRNLYKEAKVGKRVGAIKERLQKILTTLESKI